MRTDSKRIQSAKQKLHNSLDYTASGIDSAGSEKMYTTDGNDFFPRASTKCSFSAAGLFLGMVAGVSRPTSRRREPITDAERDNGTSGRNHSKRRSSFSTPEVAKAYDYSLDAITSLLARYQAHNANS